MINPLYPPFTIKSHPDLKSSQSQQNDCTSAYGYCNQCQKQHTIHQGQAYDRCLDLMKKLSDSGRIDFDVQSSASNPSLSTSYLYGEARGQMFGVLIGTDNNGKLHELKGFSGQYNGIWEVDGWAPPLFDVQEFDRLVAATDPKIKALGRKIESTARSRSGHRQLLVKARKELSRALMHKIHCLYKIHNFKGQCKTLYELYQNGIPAGAGDCCGPKLLNHAAVNFIRPLALAEFYWGRQNRSDTRRHGNFYPSCEVKCKPLMGFMLCGTFEQSTDKRHYG